MTSNIVAVTVRTPMTTDTWMAIELTALVSSCPDKQWILNSDNCMACVTCRSAALDAWATLRFLAGWKDTKSTRSKIFLNFESRSLSQVIKVKSARLVERQNRHDPRRDFVRPYLSSIDLFAPPSITNEEVHSSPTMQSRYDPHNHVKMHETRKSTSLIKCKL